MALALQIVIMRPNKISTLWSCKPKLTLGLCMQFWEDGNIQEAHPAKLHTSLSTVILNSRDWSEIVRLLNLKHQPSNRLYLKKPAGMHWLGYNDAISWLNEAKTQPAANFENFEIYLYFVCQSAVRPGCARCRAPEISHV